MHTHTHIHVHTDTCVHPEGSRQEEVRFPRPQCHSLPLRVFWVFSFPGVGFRLVLGGLRAVLHG